MIKFYLTTEHATKNHVVNVSATFDGKNPPKAVARLSGFGDTLHRDVVFDKKALEDGLKAVEEAQQAVDRIQEIADRWHKEVMSE